MFDKILNSSLNKYKFSEFETAQKQEELFTGFLQKSSFKIFEKFQRVHP